MATASDNFNRANETPLAGNWTTVPGHSATLNLSSNAVIPSNNTLDEASYWNATTFGADQFSEAAITDAFTAHAGPGAGVAVRCSTSAKTYYRLVINHTSGAANIRLVRFVAGTATLLQDFTDASFANGDVLRLEAKGGATSVVLTVKTRGSTVGTFTDTSGIASGQPGIAYSSTDSGTVTIDSWSGGDLSTTFTQSVTASVSLSASLQRQANKGLSATVTLTPTIQRQTNKNASTTVTLSASLAKQVMKSLSASVSLTATIQALKVVLQPLSASVALSPVLSRQTNKALAASVSLTGSIVRQIDKVVSTSVGLAASLATLVGAVFTQALTATVNLSASLAIAIGNGARRARQIVLERFGVY